MNEANQATTKLAQVATGSKRCKRCGGVHPLETWPLHARWKRPLDICGDCLAESRVKAGKAIAKRAAEKREAKRFADAAIANNPETPPASETPGAAPTPTTTLALALARLEGYAMGKDDDTLAGLLAELATLIGGDA